MVPTCRYQNYKTSHSRLISTFTAVRKSNLTRHGKMFQFMYVCTYICRSQWPRSLRRRSTAARLLRSWVRIPPGEWTFVCCECCVLSGRGLCDELITRPEESYRLWCVIVCDLETTKFRVNEEEAAKRKEYQTHTPLNDVYPNVAVFFLLIVMIIFHCFKH